MRMIEEDLADCGDEIRRLRNQLEDAHAEIWRLRGILKGERARRKDAETALIKARAEKEEEL